MTIPPDSIQEFIQIYQEEHGESITYEQAQALGSQLVGLYRLIMPHPP